MAIDAQVCLSLADHAMFAIDEAKQADDEFDRNEHLDDARLTIEQLLLHLLEESGE